jgi:fibronectin-binding autotransporter adhesin
MARSSFISKLSFGRWIRKSVGPKQARRAPRADARRVRLGCEALESRLTPASFAEAAGVITLSLTSNNETIAIFSNGANNYHLTTTDTANGFVTGGLVAPTSFSAPSGSTSGDLTVNPADTEIDIVDGAFTGGHIIFMNSGANPYAQFINVNLTNANAGNIDFFGTSTFNNSLTASTTRGTVTVQSGATVNLNGGTVTTSLLQQTTTGTSQRIEIDGIITTSATETALTVSAFGANVPPGINESATGAIRSNAATAVTFQLSGAAGTISLGGPNDFAGPVSVTQTGGGSVTTLLFRNSDPNAGLPTLTGLASLASYTLQTDNTSIPLDGSTLPAVTTFNYTAGSSITQTGTPLTFTNASFTLLGNNSIFLTSANNIGTVSFNALKGDNKTTVQYTAAGSVNLGAGSLGLGSFFVTAQGAGNITQSGAITQQIGAVGSSFVLDAAGTGTTINLSNIGNRLEGPVSTQGSASNFTTVNLANASLLPQFPSTPVQVTTLTLNYPNAPVILPNLGANLVTLNVTAQGIFQQTGTALTPASLNSTFTFNAGANPVVLGNANDFSGAAGFGITVNNSGPNQVVINDIDDLNFNGTSALGNGTLSVTAGGAITQSAGSAITQTANAGQTSFQSGANTAITLTNTGNALTGIVGLHTTGASGDASLTNSVALVMGNTGIGDNLTLNVTGTLTQDPGTFLSVGVLTTLTGTTTITLDNNGNVFSGSVGTTDTSFATVTLRNSLPFDFAATNVPGFLVVHSGGAITQSAPIIGGPDSLFDAGSAAITLTNAANTFDFSTSVVSTGSAPVQLRSTGDFLVGRMILGSGALSITAGGNVSELSASGLTQTAATVITISTPGSVSLNSSGNNWLGAIALSTGATALTLVNQGNIDLSGAPAANLGGAVNLTAGGTLTLPNSGGLTVSSFTGSAKQIQVLQSITTTLGNISFFGTANLTPTAGQLLNSSASINFNGDVNLGGSSPLNLTVGAGGAANLNQGTWSQGANALNISGAGATLTFNIGNGVSPATFNIIGPLGNTITMAGATTNVVNVQKFATFEVGDIANLGGVADTVTLNAGTINFNAFSTFSVGLNPGGSNDVLVVAAGSVAINSSARLTSYAGLAGTSPASGVVLSAPTGTITGTFALTTDPANNNAPHVFLMGTDIVVPTYGTTQVSVVAGGTVSPTGTVTGFEADGDKYVIKASTGATAQLTTATDVNGLLDIVIRNATGAVTLTITTTKNLGDGLTQLGGIAVVGPGTVTISAPLSDVNLGGVDPFGDIIIQGSLAALTMRDFNGSTTGFQDFIRAGGTAAQTSNITGRVFDSVSINVPTVLGTLSLAQYTNTVGIDTVTAERFGVLKTTGIASTFVLGDFIVSRLTNRNTLNSNLPGLGTVTIANQIQGQFDIQKGVTSVAAKLTNSFSLGLPGGANNLNGDLMGNVTTLNLGIVNSSNIESIGNITTITATSWNIGTLKANSFSTIKTTGNGTLPAPGNFGNFSSIVLTATGNLLGVGLGTLTVAGDAGSDTFNVLNGNVTSITVSRQILGLTLNAGITTVFPSGNPNVIVSAANSKVGTITAGLINGLTLNARLLTSVSAIGNVAAGIFGDIVAATTIIQGMPNGSPIFTGVGIGTIKAARNLANSSFTVVNGSLTTVSVGYQMSSDDILLLNNAGKLGSLTAGAWNSQMSRGLVAQSIGTITIKGAPEVVPFSPILIGNLSGVNIVAFVNSGITVGIGTFSVSGNFTLLSNGLLRSDNGITTFKVGRDVATASGVNSLISVRNANTGKVGTITVGRWFNSPNGVDFVADTIGTMTVTGYTATESPSKTNGDFLATNFVLLNTAKVDATSITVGFNQTVANLLAPGGIGMLTVGVALLGRVDTDNPKGTLGAIGTLQAGVIGDLAGSATLRAESFGTIKTVINTALSFGLGTGNSANGAMNNNLDTVTATSTTAAAGIGTVSIASFIQGATFNVPRAVTTFTVGEDIRGGAQIGAGYQAGSKIGTMSVGAITGSVVTSNDIGILNVLGKATTVFNAGVLPANITNSVITTEGNVVGIGLGTVTVKGLVSNSDFNVAGGNVTAVTVGGMYGSHLLVGFHPPAVNNILGVPTGVTWDSPPTGVTFKLGSFKTTGLFDPTDVTDSANFRDSFIIAQQLGVITITGMDTAIPTASSSSSFGIGFRGSRGAGPKITVSFSVGNVLKTQVLTAPTVAGNTVTTIPASAFNYINLAG